MKLTKQEKLIIAHLVGNIYFDEFEKAMETPISDKLHRFNANAETLWHNNGSLFDKLVKELDLE